MHVYVCVYVGISPLKILVAVSHTVHVCKEKGLVKNVLLFFEHIHSAAKTRILSKYSDF